MENVNAAKVYPEIPTSSSGINVMSVEVKCTKNQTVRNVRTKDSKIENGDVKRSAYMVLKSVKATSQSRTVKTVINTERADYKFELI